MWIPCFSDCLDTLALYTNRVNLKNVAENFVAIPQLHGFLCDDFRMEDRVNCNDGSPQDTGNLKIAVC